MNIHTSIHTRLLLSSKEVQWFERHSLCNQKIHIQLGCEKEEQVHLWGDIVLAEWRTYGEQIYVDIDAVSGTKRLDILPQKAFFQQVGLTYGGFLKKIVAQYSGTCLMMDGKEEKNKYPIIQYLETDWKLIKRIAAQLNTVIMVNSEQENPRFSIGCVKGNEYVLDHAIKKEKVISLGEHGFIITTWENYRMGDRVSVNGEWLTVFEKVTELKNGLIEYAYRLGTKKSFIVTESENEKLRGVSIRGKVLSVQDESIKLNLGMDEECDTDQLYAYRYLPITGNLMYSMPEPGIEGELYFPSSDIKEAYIRNCFLIKADYLDSSTKFMKTSHHKMLEMSSDGILWQTESEEDGVQSINLRKAAGMTFRGTERILLTADNNIILYAGASCTINATGVISMEQSESINCIKISGNGVQMSGEYYCVSSDSPKGIRKGTSEGLSDMSEANQCILAALPIKECDNLTMQLIAAIPQILFADSLNNTKIGYFR